MSLPTWTRRAVATEARTLRLRLWRAVEAQHVIATMALVDSVAEQAVLEDILDASKPPLPAECGGLHYLLYTPFRYPSPMASRFRRGHEQGVWYGAERQDTSLAELGYWRWRFVVDSDGLERLPPVAHTVFRAQLRGGGLDLAASPWVEARERWVDPADYSACHALAELVRNAGLSVIRYESVRDPRHGPCAAVLSCACFARSSGILEQQNWYLTVSSTGAVWTRMNPEPGASAAAVSFAYC